MTTVLIADDALFMRKVLGDILKREGLIIVGEVENGQAALDKYKELKPDLVTMDMVMPKVGEITNGIEAVRAIIKFDPNAKIVMVSSMGQVGLIIEAMQAGAKDFISKPFKQPRVAAAIKKALYGEEESPK